MHSPLTSILSLLTSFGLLFGCAALPPIQNTSPTWQIAASPTFISTAQSTVPLIPVTQSNPLPDSHPLSTEPSCQQAEIHLTPNYDYAIGSAHFSSFDGIPQNSSVLRWLKNGVELSQQPADDALFHFDDFAIGANGETPISASPIDYAQGKWGAALALPSHSALEYDRSGRLSLDQGTIEMWVALRDAPSSPLYSQNNQVLFAYHSLGADYLNIVQDKATGVLYAGSLVNNQWQSAYSTRASIRSWQSGQWHHLAFTYSKTSPTSSGFMRFYLDGALMADSNEGHYFPPDPSGTTFSIGGYTPWDLTANYLIDDVHLTSYPIPAPEIAAHALRAEPARSNETWLSTASLVNADRLILEYTPRTASGTGAPCQSAELVYEGIPVLNPQPPSTLLPPSATSFSLSLQSTTPTQCSYAVGNPLPFPQMIPFGESAPSTAHLGNITGLNPDPNVLNAVYVRCANHPDYMLSLAYRSLSQVNPSYPRTGNLWGSWEVQKKGLDYTAKNDLYLGADFSAADILRLRQLNPNIRILTSINAVENTGLPDSYYLKDIHGNRIEVWTNSYRLNLTHPEVAEYQARFAYQTWLDSGMMADGVFIDNFFTSQSWQVKDIYGSPVLIDADNNGQPDDPAALDVAWKAGVFHELATLRQFLPNAILSGHAMNITEPGIAENFNGISIGFDLSNVAEGHLNFGSLWNKYQSWIHLAWQPSATMLEASPFNDISYGYGYNPLRAIPPSTLDFAQHYYPLMRFGLATTLMEDGYFAYEFGDTYHGNDWTYDELNYNLGYPMTAAQRYTPTDFDPGPQLLRNAEFENALQDTWSLWTNMGCTATLTHDATLPQAGSASARINVTQTTGTDWHVSMSQSGDYLQQGQQYDLTFWARSDSPRPITVSVDKGVPDWRTYGLWTQVSLTPTWQQFILPFRATETASDARIQFMPGAQTGTVWIDSASLQLQAPDVFTRTFTNGMAILNATDQPQTIQLAAGYSRIQGDQAPLIETIVDDTNAFQPISGVWNIQTYDSGQWTAAPPFYHDWGSNLHESTNAAQANWSLTLPIEDDYTLSAWWPAVPTQNAWSNSVLYEIVSAGKVLASQTLDQTLTGDEWHSLGTVHLRPEDQPIVRITCSGICVADALHLTSALRYNNGQPVAQVTLQPYDGILLSHIFNLPNKLFMPNVMK